MNSNNKLYSIGNILRYTQEDLVALVYGLVSKPKAVGDGFTIIGRGNKPKPMLCVHLDTINTHYSQKGLYDYDIMYDISKDMLKLTPDSKASCLGGDDRAGVWIAIQMLADMLPETEWKYDIGFFKDEEIGCIGSTHYSTYLRDYAPSNINTTCYIGLDRKSGNGLHEIATYGYDNESLISTFVSLGYTPAYGSVTDASNLAGEVACINLSVGYDNEHTNAEVLYLSCMKYTLEVLKRVELEDKYYEAEEDIYDDDGWPFNDYDDDDMIAMNYIAELEEENSKLKDILQAMGVDSDSLLKEMK